jgi:hypothetical protein
MWPGKAAIGQVDEVFSGKFSILHKQFGMTQTEDVNSRKTNSFTWRAMAKGLEIQFPLIARSAAGEQD